MAEFKNAGNRAKNLIGEKHGCLTVVGFRGRKISKSGKISLLWDCYCSNCGRYCVKTTPNFRRNKFCCCVNKFPFPFEGKKALTQEILKRVLSYDEDTGIFTWNYISIKHDIGDVAGGVMSHGYIGISLYKYQYTGHRLAWFYAYGYFPENEIDHIDRNRQNNSLSNLRESSRQCNSRNTPTPKTNTSGIKGVYPAKGKWVAQISIDRKAKNLGTFSNLVDAVKARHEAECSLDWHECDSTSPAYLYLKEHGVL